MMLKWAGLQFACTIVLAFLCGLCRLKLTKVMPSVQQFFSFLEKLQYNSFINLTTAPRKAPKHAGTCTVKVEARQQTNMAPFMPFQVIFVIE